MSTGPLPADPHKAVGVLQAELAEARSEIERFRPVVEAMEHLRARCWRRQEGIILPMGTYEALKALFEAYDRARRPDPDHG